MVNFLRRLFIKDYQNVKDPKVREKHGFLASFVGVFTNLILFGFKLIIGLLTSSITIIADAINNLTDMASCFVNIIGFKLAGKPADKEHPFGHERIEYIAGLIITFIILIIGGVLGYESVMKIINKEGMEFGTTTQIILTFVVLGFSILMKLLQGFFYKKMAKLIDSSSLKASGQDSINDVITTSVVALATILEFTTGIKFDGYFGVAVSLFIIVMGIKMIIEIANPLIGTNPDKEVINNIVHDILSYDGVLGIHDLMAHCYGPTKIFMTVHVEVDCETNVMESHDLIDNIEFEVGKKHNVLLTIHMDPIDHHSKEVVSLKNKTAEILNNYSPDLKFHDFRIVKGPTHTNVLFDVVVKADSKINKNDLNNYLKESFKKINENYFLVIKIEQDYIN